MWKHWSLPFGETWLIKVTSPIVIKFIVMSLIRISPVFFLIFKQTLWLFANKLVVYDFVLFPVSSHISCCFILFMLPVLYTCSTISWSMHTWKNDNKSFTKLPTWGVFLSLSFGLHHFSPNCLTARYYMFSPVTFFKDDCYELYHCIWLR